MYVSVCLILQARKQHTHKLDPYSIAFNMRLSLHEWRILQKEL